MLKSLQMKLVLILMLLVIAVMAVVGIFLVNSVTAYNISNFKQQMADFFGAGRWKPAFEPATGTLRP